MAGTGSRSGYGSAYIPEILFAMLSPLPLPPTLLCPLPLMEPGQPLLLALLLRLGQWVMGQRMEKLEWGTAAVSAYPLYVFAPMHLLAQH